MILGAVVAWCAVPSPGLLLHVGKSGVRTVSALIQVPFSVTSVLALADDTLVLGAARPRPVDVMLTKLSSKLKVLLLGPPTGC